MQQPRHDWRTTLLAGVLAVVICSPHAALAAQDRGSITIPLNEYRGSGVSGTATLTATDGGTHVVMELHGAPLTGNHPTHIHTGTCANFDPNPLYPLTTVILDPVSAEGRSDTSVSDVSLGELLRGNYVILVHKSPQELTTYFVCGDIKASAATQATPAVVAGGQMQAPATGAGAAEGSNGALTSAGLAALAVLLAAALGGLALRSWPRR